MADDLPPSTDPEPPEKARTKKYVRRVGYVVCIGGGFAMFLMMLLGVVDGIRHDRAWDPYTGQPVEKQDCLEDARRLLLDAGEMEELDPPWVGRYRKWVTRCKDRHDDLFEILADTHSELQKLDDETS